MKYSHRSLINSKFILIILWMLRMHRMLAFGRFENDIQLLFQFVFLFSFLSLEALERTIMDIPFSKHWLRQRELFFILIPQFIYLGIQFTLFRRAVRRVEHFLVNFGFQLLIKVIFYMGETFHEEVKILKNSIFVKMQFRFLQRRYLIDLGLKKG